jgi:hypothetical protein
MIPQAIAHYRIKAAADFSRLYLSSRPSGVELSSPAGTFKASSGVVRRRPIRANRGHMRRGGEYSVLANSKPIQQVLHDEAGSFGRHRRKHSVTTTARSSPASTSNM